MEGYLIGVIGVALCVGLLEELLPGRSQSKAYVRLLTGLCILAVMIAPLGRFLRFLPELLSEISVSEDEDEARYDEILQGTLEDAVREELKEAILISLAEEFSVDREKSEVGILFSGGETWEVARVVITLRGKDILKDPYEIEEYFSARLGCECLVVVG